MEVRSHLPCFRFFTGSGGDEATLSSLSVNSDSFFSSYMPVVADDVRREAKRRGDSKASAI
jgi:hypothetical protein